MDDILVYAASADEFVANLRKVFQRLREHRIYINPKKCKLGLKHVQFVGHELSGEGVHWSSEKIQVVLDFPVPKTLKGLRAFLGLANYFRDHVRDHSVLAEPLQKMVFGPNKHRVLKFNEVELEAFNKLKQAIAECPMLWFVDENSPIHLQTDACDFGIGAYLFQLINGVERPIYFLSKALSLLQQRWSTFEKEAYAIYFTLVKLSYLLRDVPFVLHTDHRNLTFITTDSSAKVLRWKLYLQEHNYEIQYIPGPENVVADAFSRLCVLDGENRRHKGPATTLALLSSSDSFPARPMDEFNHFIMNNDVYEKIERVHNQLAGHHGVERTVAKLNASNETWVGRRADVKNFIKHCPLCQKCKYDTVISKTVPFTNAAYEPMFCLNIDSIGPVKDGKHILVIICCFTRFVELFCVNDTTAKEAAKCLFAHFGRYGAPTKLKSDRGSQFVNDVIEEFLPMVGIHHVLTLAYSKEESGIVERANKEVMRHVRALIFEKGMQDEWETTLPLVQRIMNASVHSAIGVSPAQLLFGNSIDLDRGIFVPQEERDEVNSAKPLSPWLSNMLEKQQILLAKAQQLQLESDTHHIARHTVSEEEITVYPVNSYVLVKYNDRPPSKLNTPLKGPMRVIAVDGAKYTLQDLVLDRIQHVHVSKLRPFVYDPVHTDPRVVANKERESFDVENILSHTGSSKKKSEMMFKTTWTGYSENEYTFQPWSSLRDNGKLHQYLINNNLKRLVPVKYRYLYPEAFSAN
jgi:transposase InsO family protein